ncbi:MAG TPA: hypothetical protein VM935_14645 [Chitinophagaceae bacterium]|nr:hypothetical protein [Chitinophagaceae bacterium]
MKSATEEAETKAVSGKPTAVAIACFVFVDISSAPNTTPAPGYYLAHPH